MTDHAQRYAGVFLTALVTESRDFSASRSAMAHWTRTHTQRGEPVTLGGQVLLVGGASGVPDE